MARWALSADGAILDLEDAVAPGEKLAARVALAGLLATLRSIAP
jgi:citrate lyase beta subunit